MSGSRANTAARSSCLKRARCKPLEVWHNQQIGIAVSRCVRTSADPTGLLRSTLALIGLLVGSLFSACVPYSKQPLLAETNSRIDEALLGVWWTDSGERFEIKRADARNNSLAISDDGKTILLRTAKLDKVRIMTGTRLEGADDTIWHIVKYQVSRDGKLRIFILQESKIATAIESGRLNGKVVRNKRRGFFSVSEFSRVVVDDMPGDVVRFLDNNADDVFFDTPHFSFTRTKPIRPANNANLIKQLFR